MKRTRPISRTLGKTLAVVVRISLVVLLLGAGYAAFSYLEATKPTIDRLDDEQIRPRVSVAEPTRIEVRRQWRGHGTAAAIRAANIPALVNAPVAEIPEHIVEGRRVERGELLMQLDDSEYARQRDRAREEAAALRQELHQLEVEARRADRRAALEADNLELAERNLARTEQLAEQGNATPQDLDRARQDVIRAELSYMQTAEFVDNLVPRRAQLQARIDAAEAQAALAQLHVDRCRIESPVDGIVQAVDVKADETVGPQQRLLRVVDLRRIEVPLRLPAAAGRDVAVGDPVTLRTSGGRRNTEWSAPIARIAPEADARSRAITVYVELDQADLVDDYGDTPGGALLKPGTYLSGHVEAGRPELRWVVPRRALRAGRLFTVRDGRLATVPVEIDYSVERRLPETGLPDELWMVLEGDEDLLDPAVPYLIAAPTTLLDGQAVEAVPFQGENGAARNASSPSTTDDQGDRP